MSRPTLKFFYDIASINSWVLFEQLCAAERCFGFKFEFKPVRMSSIYLATGYKHPNYLIAIRKYMFNDIKTYLKQIYGVPFMVPTRAELKLSYIGTDSAQRFLTSVALNHPESLRNVSRFLWKRMWIQDLEVYGREDFEDIVREANLSSKIEDFSDSTTEAALKKAEKEVVDYGGFDVPFTVIEKENSEPAIFIGMDNWPLIARRLELPADRRGFYSLRDFNHLFDRTDGSSFT